MSDYVAYHKGNSCSCNAIKLNPLITAGLVTSVDLNLKGLLSKQKSLSVFIRTFHVFRGKDVTA